MFKISKRITQFLNMCNFFEEKSEVEMNTEKCGKLRMEMRVLKWGFRVFRF